MDSAGSGLIEAFRCVKEETSSFEVPQLNPA